MWARPGRLCVCVAAVAVLACQVRAQQPGLAPAPLDGVVLLRNGQVIEGRITRSGDLYYVVFPEGEIRLKAAEVEHCCRNLEEGYQRKRAAVPLGSVEEHLRLAQWCHRHRLFEAAAAEVADARRSDPKHPMIDVVQHRLEAAAEPQRPAPPPASAEPSLSLEQLDRMVRGLPAGSMENFTQTIQPILLNNCTTGGCHGPLSDTKFRLLRIPSGRPPSRRLTQRNLYEVLQWVDQAKPETSALLSVPLQPHGKAKTAVFRDHQVAQYRRLVDWAFEVSGSRRPEVAAADDARPKAAAHAAPEETRGFDFSPANARRVPHAPTNVGPISNRPQTGRTGKPPYQKAVDSGKQASAGGRSPVNRGAAVEPSAPADPFDPEVFNRRFLGQQPGVSPPDKQP